MATTRASKHTCRSFNSVSFLAGFQRKGFMGEILGGCVPFVFSGGQEIHACLPTMFGRLKRDFNAKTIGI
jgi:hypothetical protein